MVSWKRGNNGVWDAFAVYSFAAMRQFSSDSSTSPAFIYPAHSGALTFLLSTLNLSWSRDFSDVTFISIYYFFLFLVNIKQSFLVFFFSFVCLFLFF